MTLRLIHTPDKKPVNNAVIFQASADIRAGRYADDDRAGQARCGIKPGSISSRSSREWPGIGRSKLAAKVQGEAETVRAALPVKTREVTCARRRVCRRGTSPASDRPRVAVVRPAFAQDGKVALGANVDSLLAAARQPAPR